MISAQQKNTVIVNARQTIKKTAAYIFYILFAIYGISIALVLLARFATTPQIVEVFTISDNSIAKLQGPENYVRSKLNAYITQVENDP